MIREKHSAILEGEFLPREKQMKWIEDKLSNTSVLYMYGAAGCGKTITGKLYLKEKKQAKSAYLLLDEYDNNTELLIANVVGVISQMGICLKPAEVYKELIAVFYDVVNEMEQSKEEYLIFLDHIHVLQNPESRKALFYLMKYLPRNCRMILASQEPLPRSWEPLCFNGRVSFASVSDLVYDKRELRNYFQMRKMTVPDNQINLISRMTNGWPGVITMIGTAKLIDKDAPEKIRIFLDSFIEGCLWNTLKNKEKKLLLFGCRLPFFEESLLSEVMGRAVDKIHLDQLFMQGLLAIDFETGYYTVSTMMRGFLERKTNVELTAREQKNLTEKARIWMEQRGYLKEMLVMIPDAEELERVLIRNAEMIPGRVPLEKLIDYLLLCEPLHECKEKLLLDAYVAAKVGNDKLLDDFENKIYNLWETDKTDRKCLEYYLNMKYWDYRIDICTWIKLVEELWDNPQKVHLYIYSGYCPVICSGIKNYADLFICNTREKKNLVRIWKQYLDDEAQLALELAEYDYYIQTQRYGKVFEQIQPLYDKVVESNHGELLAGIYYLFDFFKDHKFSYDFSIEREIIWNRLKASRFLYVWHNSVVLEHVLGADRKEEELVLWLLYDAPEEKGRYLCDNPYLLLIKARCYYRIKQYRKAMNLCSKLYHFYEKRNIAQYQTECMFEVAASLYEEGHIKEASDYGTKAFIIGNKYRFINLYTYYGSTGVALVEHYQKITEVKVSEKKQYYYGNILKADFATFQQILLRCVKKARKGAVTVDYSESMDINRMTMTETVILSYINQGYANQEIADAMNIKLTTVKNHIYNIYRKLDVSTRVQAVNEAKKKGLLQ